MPNTRFPMPDAPKNSFQMFQWLIFEPLLRKRFLRKLPKREYVKWYSKGQCWTAMLFFILWIVRILFFLLFDIPSAFPQGYNAQFLVQWQDAPDIFTRFYLLVSFTHNSEGWGSILLAGTFAGLVVEVTIMLSRVLCNSIFYNSSFNFYNEVIEHFTNFLGIFAALVFGLGISLVLGGDNSSGGFVFGMAFGVAVGEAFENSRSADKILGVIAGIACGITGIALLDLTSGMIISLGWYVVYFKLIFYPIHVVKSFFKISFDENPYRKDGLIYLPISFADAQLIQLSEQSPDIGFDFANFLLEYRPLQIQLAMHILHVATAGKWSQHAFQLHAEVLSSPIIPETQKKFQPSVAWNTQLDNLRAQLIISQTQTQIGFRKDSFEQFLKSLHEFRIQTLRESNKWNYFYLEAIDKWITVANEKLESLKLQAETLEPITHNIYRSGEALRPETDQTIFLGRNDLKETLSFEILTARQMPMFLIQGQRRVGKTSLLNFLPDLLGPRFKIVYLDLQGLGERTAAGWFKAIRKAVARANKDIRGLPDPGYLEEWNPPADWLSAWEELRMYLEQIRAGQDYKLILAFDEYEILHDDILNKDPDRARHLLGAMRSFAQHQNQVVFLWVGARYFSELQNPNWNEFFVQVKHLQVDYLKCLDTLQLIQHPVPDFNLIYPDEVANRIFDLTQGHPAVVQQICSEIVNRANRNNRKHITDDDLNDVLEMFILFRENLTIQIFWTQFCTPQDRVTIKQILAGQAPNDPISRYRLIQHGYIVPDGDTWKMRVPLFESWLRTFIETFPT